MKNRPYLLLAVLALLAITIWNLHAQNNFVMRQKWDYQVVKEDSGDGIYQLNKAGREGWELVTTIKTSDAVYHYMKRVGSR